MINMYQVNFVQHLHTELFVNDFKNIHYPVNKKDNAIANVKDFLKRERIEYELIEDEDRISFVDKHHVATEMAFISLIQK